ncbi:hypothetical protein DCAR_0624363 [Daucus carota subsp. sativus]|uniref:Tyrosinase copper-binding domain-containing protein n=1 Tax=Daucus carota subsp. sativus TaxID=79200 RepID=A0AAF0XEP0_DAUCS|nr:hypothetical protein DCAR_0624363 [Daucus carota subsp. sativus]
MDVHFSWLFFPFHRWYMYFFEKILGKLIDDPTFAIPFWNWDSPAGMPIPPMFADPYSPLYDKLRNDNHRPPLPADLNYSKTNPSLTGEALIESNMSVMYTQMVSNSSTPELFFGGPYSAGQDQVHQQGSIENQPHTQVHIWTGDPDQPNGEDMGRFYSAGRDPIFYAHHANVDRMWNIWKDLDPEHHKDLDNTDWLDAAFLFYDETETLVRVKIRDCLDTAKLGYTYQNIPLPWLKFHPKRKPIPKGRGGDKEFPKASEVFPKVLDVMIKVTVPRPKKSRSKEEKEAQQEILVIEGIEYDGDEYVKFDVYVNGDDEVGSGPVYADFAGVFSNVPSTKKTKVKATQSFGLSKLLEDLKAEDDENVVVALVPRTGQGKVTGGSAV